MCDMRGRDLVHSIAILLCLCMKHKIHRFFSATVIWYRPGLTQQFAWDALMNIYCLKSAKREKVWFEKFHSQYLFWNAGTFKRERVWNFGSWWNESVPSCSQQSDVTLFVVDANAWQDATQQIREINNLNESFAKQILCEKKFHNRHQHSWHGFLYIAWPLKFDEPLQFKISPSFTNIQVEL